jgi:cytochrome P450 family 142 subfamily A polypeptide 1
VSDIDFVSGEFWGGDPHAGLTWCRENDPVHWDGQVWGITKHAHLRDIATQPELFSNAQGIRPDAGPVASMIDKDDPEHLLRRKLVATGFTPRRVVAQEARVLELTDGIIDRICEKGECDLVRDVAAWLPIEVIGQALGFPSSDFEKLLDWSDSLMSALVGVQDDETAMKMLGAFEGYTEYLTGAVAERRATPTDDLISILVHAEVDGHKLDDEALLHESLLILIGGDETSRHVMSGGVYQLLKDRDQWDRLSADRSLMPTAVEEMLRWVSPIRNMNRTVTRDLEFEGKQMSEGDKVLLLYPSANRDADVFEEPFRFDITRSPNEHVAFGLGPHFCLGNALARVEVRTMVDRLLERLPDLELVESSEPALRPANFVSGYESLPVRFTPTAPLS